MSIFSTLPYTLTNGSTADATQVMANFNQIVNNGNANAAANGANSDITSLSGLTTPLSITQGGTGVTTGVFPSGTVMLFQQTTAPTGWTKLTTNNDCALRVVSGTAGTGGSVAFSTAFSASNTVDGHTLTSAEIPAHTHPNTLNDPGHVHWPSGHNIQSADYSSSGTVALANGSQLEYTLVSATTGVTITNAANTGGGGAHSHTLSNLAVKYVDCIAASRN